MAVFAACSHCLYVGRTRAIKARGTGAQIHLISKPNEEIGGDSKVVSNCCCFVSELELNNDIIYKYTHIKKKQKTRALTLNFIGGIFPHM